VGAAAGGASSFSVTISLWNLVITSMIMLLLRWLSGWPGNFFIKLKHGTEG
jgi:ABC-type sulfate transport system permease component